MSLNVEQMHALCEEMGPVLEDARLIGCAHLPPRSWILTFQNKADETFNLLLCFQHPFIRFHLLSRRYAHQTDPFSELVLKNIKDFKLSGCRLINQDRILELQFQKKGVHYALVGEFFSKSPNFYLLDAHKGIIGSIFPLPQKEYSPPSRIQKPFSGKGQPAETCTHSFIEKHYHSLEKEWELKEERRRLENLLAKQVKRAQKKIADSIQHLEECGQWEKKMHEASLLQANLYRLKKGMEEVLVSDWEADGKEVKIALDSLLPPHVEIAKRFRASKKLKTGLEYAQQRLEKAKEEEQSLRVLQEQLGALLSLKELEKFAEGHSFLSKPGAKKSASQEAAPAKPFREFFTAAGLAVWVGKSAKDNEKLTFSIARGGDWWFHARDYSGSHVVLRPQKNGEPDQESIQDAIQLALFYSKAKDKGEGEVCLTQRKYVSRIGKKTGAVTISKHKVTHANLDLERIRQIQQRRNSG